MVSIRSRVIVAHFVQRIEIVETLTACQVRLFTDFIYGVVIYSYHYLLNTKVRSELRSSISR